MKIAAYVHLKRTRIPTGVGKHIINMVLGLAAVPSTEVTVLAPRRELDLAGKIPADSPLSALTPAAVPFKRRTLELLCCLCNWPKVDRWCPGMDWIYSPAEAFVATGKTPLAVTVHDTYHFEPDQPWSNDPDNLRMRRIWTMKFRAIRRHAKLILAVSEFTKSRLVSLLDFDPARIVVVGNGVEDVYFEEPSVDGRDEPALTPSPYLYVIGGLAHKKGGEYLLSVATRLRVVRPDMRLVICGVGESPLEEQAAQLDNIIRLGYEPLERQVRRLRGARALLMLSRYEGFGIPALEAMAAGTPAIVSSRGALPEVMADAGLVVDPAHTNDVVDAIEKVDGDQQFRDAQIARGRQRADQFRWSNAVARLHQALQMFMGR